MNKNTNEKTLRLIANQILWMCDNGIINNNTFTLKQELYSVCEILIESNTPKDFGKDVWDMLLEYYTDPDVQGEWFVHGESNEQNMPCDTTGICSDSCPKYFRCKSN